MFIKLPWNSCKVIKDKNKMENFVYIKHTKITSIHIDTTDIIIGIDNSISGETLIISRVYNLTDKDVKEFSLNTQGNYYHVSEKIYNELKKDLKKLIKNEKKFQ